MKARSFGKVRERTWSPVVVAYMLLVQKLQYGISRKTTAVFKILQALQIVSLIIPPYAPSDSPWAHSGIGFFWVSLHIVVRFDSLFIDIFKAPIAFYTTLGLIVLLYYITAASSVNYIRHVNEDELMSRIMLSHDTSISFKFKSHLVLVAVVNHLLLVPLVAGVFKLETSFPYLERLAAPGIIGILLVGLLPIHLLGFCVFTPINWKAAYQACANPYFNLLQLAFFYFACGVSVLVPSTSGAIYHSSALLVVGGVQCLFIASFMPYNKLYVNCSNFFLGFLMFFAGLVLLLSFDLTEGINKIFAPLLYFMTLVPMIFVIRHFLKKRLAKLMRIRFINSNSEFEFSLREFFSLHESDDPKVKLDIKNRIESVGLTDAVKHNMVCIWMTYYCLLIGDVMMTQFYLSVLRSHQAASIVYFHQQLLMKEAIIAINLLPEHADIHKFIDFYQNVNVLLEKDCRACVATYEFFSELVSIGPKYESLSRKAQAMTERLTEAKRFYRKLLVKNKNNSELLNYFAGFIEITESAAKAQSLTSQARKEAFHLDKKFASKQSIINFMDPKCSSFIVSFEASDFGTILWHKNAIGLGLSETDLIDAKFEFLLPQMFDDLQGSRLERIKKFSFGKTRKFYVVLKSGQVHSVLVKLELINHSDGSLAGLLGIRSLTETVVGVGLIIDNKLTYATTSLSAFLWKEYQIEYNVWTKLNIEELLNISFTKKEQEILKRETLSGKFRLVYKKFKNFKGEFSKYLVLEMEDQEIHTIPTSSSIMKMSFTDDSFAPPTTYKTATFKSQKSMETLLKPSTSFISEPDNPEQTKLPQLLSSTNSCSGVSAVIDRSSSILHKQTNKARNLIRLSYALSILIFVICSIILNIVTSEINTELSKSVDFLDNLGLMRFNSASMAYHSKSLNLIGSGTDKVSNETAIRQTMRGGLGLLKTSVHSYREELSTTVFDDSHDINAMPWWNYVDIEFKEERNNLYDILNELVGAAEVILDTESPNINSGLREFQIIQRNFPVEVLNYLNGTVEAIVENAQERVEDSKMLFLYLITLSCCCFLLSFIAFFLPPFFKILMTSKKIWKVYESIPHFEAISIMASLSQRVAELHGEELANDEKRSTKRFRSISIKLTCDHFGLMLVTLITWGSLALFAVLMTKFSSSEIFEVLSVKPNYIHFGGLQRGCNSKTLYFMREIAFPGEYWAQNRHYADPYEGFVESVECVRFAAQKCLSLYDSRYDNMTALILEDARTSLLTVPNLGRGLYIALKDLTEMDYAVANSLRSGVPWGQLYGGFFPKYSQIISAVSNSLATYANATNNQLDEASDKLELYTVIFCMWLAAFFVVFIDYFIRRIIAQVASEIKLLKPLSCVRNPEYWVTNLPSLSLK
mmetsp:Transcript_26373/g.47339  ORF Transcript_26373/g.47339 Transcript_26373/m.47339 type:complete len:1375 (-) Transcript_26373:17-4141(-)